MPAPTHLNALRAFEAAARHQSFSEAAIELSVTPAAVGQQVRSLEALLGVSLFIRIGSGANRLILTDAAQAALPYIQEGFDRLNFGLACLKDDSRRSSLTVALSPAFASKWLLPRIERFQQAYPTINVLLDTNPRSVDFKSQHFDIGVRYGSGEWVGLIAIHLMDEVIFPVCSPNFRLLQNGILEREALEKSTLIHDLSMAEDHDYPTWRMWLDASGYEHIATGNGLRVTSSAEVLQAAIEGHGLALARSVIVHDDLAAGRLMRPFVDKGLECPLTQAYYLVYKEGFGELAKVRNFRDWLLAEARNFAQVSESCLIRDKIWDHQN